MTVLKNAVQRNRPPAKKMPSRAAGPERPISVTATPFPLKILFWTLFSTGAKPKSASKASEHVIEKVDEIYLVGRRVFRRLGCRATTQISS